MTWPQKLLADLRALGYASGQFGSQGWFDTMFTNCFRTVAQVTIIQNVQIITKKILKIFFKSDADPRFYGKIPDSLIQYEMG